MLLIFIIIYFYMLYLMMYVSVEELKLGVDDDASTLATQETSVKKLVYITNIQEEIKGTNYKMTHEMMVRIQVVIMKTRNLLRELDL